MRLYLFFASLVRTLVIGGLAQVLLSCKNEKLDLVPSSKKPWKTIPNVAVQTLSGDTIHLSALCKLQPVLLSVYLGTGCPMCVVSMKQLSQHAYRYRSYGWRVLGLSNDSPESNRRALAEPRLDSSFIQPGGEFEVELLSDFDHNAMEALGCYRRHLDTERHGLFLIDTAGYIRFEYIDKRPFQNWSALTDTMKAIFFKLHSPHPRTPS
ncbi:MAG: redoxin domain-containing protein [Bacteroidota bacterium]|nr:redoxin domain-containing protein [Candidatus Kapabacteria bacterium]MDW8218956.1 redoxin domain-containing protein [Bacteroidota bacterium]